MFRTILWIMNEIEFHVFNFHFCSYSCDLCFVICIENQQLNYSPIGILVYGGLDLTIII